MSNAKFSFLEYINNNPTFKLKIPHVILFASKLDCTKLAPNGLEVVLKAKKSKDAKHHNDD